MTSHSGRTARDGARRAVLRWLVHLGLIATVVVSLMFEPLVLAIHIAVGLVFVVLVGRDEHADSPVGRMPSMFGRSALASAFAATSLAVVLLAATGCKVQVGSLAQASSGPSGAGPAGSPGVTRAGPLIVEPGAGFSPVYKLIDGARHSIDVTMYELSDTTAEHDLAAAAQRGVRVHVILDQREQSDLVWSPAGSEDQLLGLINGATSSLRIYSEEMGDTTVENALVRAAKRGVDVQVCGENQGGEYDRAYSELARAGIRISYYSSSAGFYIHGKVIAADYGTARGKVFIGSENFSNTSLNDNRELGLIISSHAVMSAIASTFAADFRHGQHWL